MPPGQMVFTRMLVAPAFVRLLLDKPFERVTVQDILDEARVNRKTFYKRCVDKYALADSSFAGQTLDILKLWRCFSSTILVISKFLGLHNPS